jgi:hypothetical protein
MHGVFALVLARLGLAMSCRFTPSGRIVALADSKESQEP